MARVEADFEGVPEIEESEAEGSFGYDAEHGKWVNYDTEYASPPPFDPIYQWVDRKWNDLDEGLKLAALDEDDDTARQRAEEIPRDDWKREVTNLVRFGIFENGIEGVRFMERSIERARADMEAIAQVYEDSDDPRAGFKIVRDLLDFAFGISQDIVADEATDRGSLLQSGYVNVQQTQGSNEFEEEGR